MILSRLICTTSKALRVQSSSCPQNEHDRSSNLQMLNHPNLNKTFQQNKYFQKKSRQQCLALMLTTSHLPCSGPLVVLMLEEVGSQKHRLDISLELIASLEDTLESCVSLVSMPCVKNLVVGVYPGLQRFRDWKQHTIYTKISELATSEF